MSGFASDRNILLITALFFIISILNVLVSIQLTNAPYVSGNVLRSQGQAQVCIRKFPTLNINSSFNLTEGTPFSLQVNYTNRENISLTFFDDAFFFDINSTTAEINFTPNVSSVGNHSVKIYLFESGATCQDLTLTTNVLFNIYGFSKLQIWDETDPKGGNKTRHAIDKTLFFANYSMSNNTIIQTGDTGCYFRINVTGDYTNFSNMTYNSSYKVYVANYTTNANGNFSWQVFCNSTNSFFFNANASDNVSIFNNPPVKIADYPNETWNANTVLFGPSLFDYFADPDKDKLSFTSSLVSQINITIDNLTGVVKFVSAINFYGNRTVVFTASDGYGGTAQSEPTYLYVLFVQNIGGGGSGSSGGSSGGGGGGGGIGGLACLENWQCSPYGPCLPTSLRVRGCSDISDCGTLYSKPNDSEACYYKPTCQDNVRNQGELGVDCGGPCQACPTCFDHTQNQGELGIDCGGLCPACSSCYDNVQNQNETGIDCGGPCSPCPSCKDGIQNQGELGIDCGGPCSKACAVPEKPGAIVAAHFRLIGFVIFLLVILAAASMLTYKYAWPRFALLLKKRKYEDRITLSEVITQTLEEMGKVKKRASNVPPKEIIDDVSDLFKSFFYHYFELDTPFSFNMMSLVIEQHPQPAKLQKALVAYAKKITDMEYDAEAKKEETFNLVKDSELILNECAKAARPIIIRQNSAIIKELIDKIKDSLKAGNLRTATRSLSRIRKLVMEIPEKDRKKFEGAISELSEKIKGIQSK